MVHSVLFMLLLFGGILFLVGGLFLTRLTWRTDVEPFRRRSRPFQIALHPETLLQQTDFAKSASSTLPERYF